MEAGELKFCMNYEFLEIHLRIFEFFIGNFHVLGLSVPKKLV
jgi:hypothetical protein